MLNNIFVTPVELEINKKVLRFFSLAEFEFCLIGRVSIPSKKITDMLQYSLKELKKEARKIRKFEKHFVSALSLSIEDPESVNRVLKEIDPRFFSQDHEWRLIMKALHQGDDRLNEFRRVALVKYMQYLSSRQEIIKCFYAEKKKYCKVENGTHATEDSERKDTLTLDDTLFGPLQQKNAKIKMSRMPKGEAISFHLKPDEEVNITLSKHVCKIKGGVINEFIDNDGEPYGLKIGKNLIGRDSTCDIIISPVLRTVSRIHVLIELDERDSIRITDFSSHGTYLPEKYIRNQTF